MIRYISLALLTLTLSCSNKRPESVDQTQAATEQTAAATTASATETAVKPKVDTTESTTKKPAKPKKKREWAHRPPRKSDIAAQAARAAEQPAPTEEVSTQSAPEVIIDTVCVFQPVLEADPSESVATTDAATIGSTLSSGLPTSAGTVSPFSPAATEVPAESVLTKKKRSRDRHFLPTRKRIDREIDRLKFVYKGEVIMGITASYGTLSSDDTDIMLVLDNFNASGTIASVKPFLGYFYRDNNCVGVRFGYQHIGGTLDNLNIDLGESNDANLKIPYFDLKSDTYSFGLFHRSYAGLDPKGRFGLFAEFELSVSTGSSEFAYDTSDNRYYNDNTKVRLSFNPGAAVYIFPNVCATLSFGLGGIQYSSVTQRDGDGNKTGSRQASSMKFKLNLAAINFGMTIHLWDKKKQ